MAKKKHANTNDLPTNPELATAPEVAKRSDAALTDDMTSDAPETALADAPDVSDASSPKRRGAKRRGASVDVTLAELAERYLMHLDEDGKSQGTVFSYRLELVIALDELGAETKLADLTPDLVLGFFTSDRVTKTRTGVLKARVSVLKTQRVLRQALVWAEGAGLVAKAPLPEDAATF